MEKNNIDGLLTSLTEKPVMELIFNEKILNDLKKYLKNNSNMNNNNINNNNMNNIDIFDKYYHESLKYDCKNKKLLFFSKSIYGKISDEDFNIYVYRFLRKYEEK